MTELLYQVDSYLKEFDAEVIDSDFQEGTIVLNRTAFYPGGGGQPCDLGKLCVGAQVAEVKKVKKKGDKVVHWLDENPFPAGTKVRGCIDWDRRYKLMRTHTALHILCGVVWRDYRALVTGGNMEPLKGRMDFEFKNLNKDLVEEIEHKVNIEVKKGREVSINILPREEAFKIPDLIRTKINLLPQHIKKVRVVEIKGLDIQADGGTHVANTREVGPIKIVDYKSKGKLNKRIYIELAE